MRVVVKVGSNVLTRQDMRVDVTRISAIVDQIATLRRAGHDVLLVSSGAVASGKARMTLPTQMDETVARQIYAAVGQVDLMNHYYALLAGYDIAAAQVLTMKENFAEKEHYDNQKNCIEGMITCGVLPIINENDTVSVVELMFTDNDELAGLIARMVKADMLVILSNVDGLYDGDPCDKNSRVIRRIEPEQQGLEKHILGSHSSAGRGGMVSKFNTARTVARSGIEVVIANGTRRNILIDVVLDRDATTPCTRFLESENDGLQPNI